MFGLRCKGVLVMTDLIAENLTLKAGESVALDEFTGLRLLTEVATLRARARDAFALPGAVKVTPKPRVSPDAAGEPSGEGASASDDGGSGS